MLTAVGSIQMIEHFGGTIVLTIMINNTKKAKGTSTRTVATKSATPKSVSKKSNAVAANSTKTGSSLKEHTSGEMKAMQKESHPTKPNQVSLELVNPAAKAVYVAGSFNEWKPETTPLVPLGNGRWGRDLTVKPGRHEYLFVVDGQWLPDPNAKESVANPFGGKNSVLIVSE